MCKVACTPHMLPTGVDDDTGPVWDGPPAAVLAQCQYGPKCARCSFSCALAGSVQKEAEGKVDSELAVVLSSIATACKQISSLVSRSGISGMTGLAGAANIQVHHLPLLPAVMTGMSASLPCLVQPTAPGGACVSGCGEARAC